MRIISGLAPDEHEVRCSCGVNLAVKPTDCVWVDYDNALVVCNGCGKSIYFDAPREWIDKVYHRKRGG